MFDYRTLLSNISSITEEELSFIDTTSENRFNIVKQYNKALLNAQGDGTDVAQIFLKPLIVNYGQWAEPALVFGLCLAREYKFERAKQSIEFALSATFVSTNNSYIAQEALKQIKISIEKGDKEVKAVPENSKSKKGSSGNTNNNRSLRVGMQTPILTRASNGNDNFKVASDRERRDIMMRSASSGDEMASDDLAIESMRTPADKMRIRLNVLIIIVVVLLVVGCVYFFVVPFFAKAKQSEEATERLYYLVDKLGKSKNDPEVAKILKDYAEHFDLDIANDIKINSTSATTTTSQTTEITLSSSEENVTENEAEVKDKDGQNKKQDVSETGTSNTTSATSETTSTSTTKASKQENEKNSENKSNDNTKKTDNTKK